MALFPLSDLLTTWADGISKALRIKSETSVVGSIPAGTNTIGIVDIGKNIQTVSTSTTAILDASATYTGTLFPTGGNARITGSVFADVAGTLYIDQSSDGTNYDITTTVSVSAGVGTSFSVEVFSPNARIRYVNGATIQTVFRLYSFLRRI